MDFKLLLSKIDGIAVNMKKHHVKPKNEDGMSDAENNPTGPKFVGKMKGTDPAGARYNKYVGGESVLRDYEQVLREPRHRTANELMREYREFVTEYSSTTATVMPGQDTPTPGTNQKPNPAAAQQDADSQQIQKSVSQLKPVLNAQGTAPLNQVKFQDTMNKMDTDPKQPVAAGNAQQLAPLAAAASKALQNTQTAAQLKQVLTRADQLDQQKQQQVAQAQQQTGTNTAAGQQKPQSTTPAGITPPGKTQ
jgi:hypothetical protein